MDDLDELLNATMAALDSFGLNRAAETVARASTEIERLRAEVEEGDRQSKIMLDSYADENQRISDERDRLRAEVAALRADAQTKDALLDRAHDLLEFIGCSPEGARNDILMAKTLQRDIDAARAAQGNKT